MGGFEPPLGQALDLSPLPGWATWSSGPPGWTRTTTSRGKNPECCIDTTGGRKSFWIGLRVSHPFLHAGDVECTSTPRPITDRSRAPVRRVCRLSKNPLFRAGGRQGIRTQWPPAKGRTGLRPASGPSARTARRYVALRMRRRTHLTRHLARAFLASRGQNKKAFQGIALEGLMLD